MCSGRRSARPAEVGVADSGKTGEELTVVGFQNANRTGGLLSMWSAFRSGAAHRGKVKWNSRKKAQKTQKNLTQRRQDAKVDAEKQIELQKLRQRLAKASSYSGRLRILALPACFEIGFRFAPLRLCVRFF